MNIMIPKDPPDDDLPQIDVEPLQIQTPVIRIQDLEHTPGPDTRVSNKGLVVPPPDAEEKEEEDAAGS